MINVYNLHIWPGLGADSLQHLGRQPRPRGQGGGLAAGRTLRGEVRWENGKNSGISKGFSGDFIGML